MANHEFTLEEVLKGKATKIKGKEYFRTADYVEPFLDRMSKFTSDFRVQVKEPDQITVDDSGDIITDDLTFNRVALEAILPNEYAFEGHKQVIGMVFGLDVRKPIVKFFSGAERSVCTNLCIFNPTGLHIEALEPETAIDYDPIRSLIERTQTITNTLHKLSETEFVTSEQNINENLGKWIRNAMELDFNRGFGKVKIATSLILDMYKDLFVNDESEYFTGKNNCSMFNIYNCLTQQLTNEYRKNKDIINRAEKTILAAKILEI